MILYTNGDSFVAGSGLALHLLPNYPGVHDHADEKIYKENRQWIDRCYSNPQSFKLVAEVIPKVESAIAFPNKIKKLLNCQVINNAQGGSSFDRIARTTITDLIGLKKSNPDSKIVAIIGDTDIFRSEVAYNRLGENTWFQMHCNLTPPQDLKNLLRYKLLHEHNYHRMLEYYKHWILIKDFCKLNNIEVHWIDIGMVQEDHRVLTQHPDLAQLKEYADVTASVNMSTCAMNVKGKFLPDGHFSEPVHAIVAEQFAKILEKYKV
jgi:hypothetical protein